MKGGFNIRFGSYMGMKGRKSLSYGSVLSFFCAGNLGGMVPLICLYYLDDQPGKQ